MFLALLLWFYMAVLYIVSRHKAIALYLILLPLVPFYWAPFYIVPFNALNIQRFMAIGLIGGVVLQTLNDITKRHIQNIQLHLGYFLFFNCIIWFISMFEFSTFSNWIRMIVFSILDFWFPFYAGMVIAKDGKVVPILKCIVWSSVIVGLFVFYEFFSQTPIVYNWFASLPNKAATPSGFSGWEPSMRAGMYRVQAGLAQPIFAGFYLTCTSLLAFILSRVQPGYKKNLYLLLGSFLFITFLFPMARSAFIGFIGAVLVFVLLVKAISRWKVVLGIGLVVALTWVASNYWEGVKTFWTNFVLTVIGKTNVDVQAEQLVNWEGRLEVIRKGVELLVKAPVFGYGDISFGGAWIIRDICNVFIQVSLQAGFPGLFLLLTFLIVIGIQSFKLWKREKNQQHTILVAGMIGCYVMVLASWLFSSWPGQFTQLGLFLLGMLHGMHLTKSPVISSEWESSPEKKR